MKRFLLFFAIFLLSSTFVAAQLCTEGEKRACGFNNEGECRMGSQICTFGQWSVCFGSIGPENEVCGDGKDNDCDGEIDEQCDCQNGETQQCGTTSVGACELGTERCVNGTWSGLCEGEVTPIPEICTNTLDDDCDGEINEGCTSATNATPSPTQTCFNNVQDGDEIGVDCGGVCKTCVSCTDGVLNQGELKVNVILEGGNTSDCGGPQCPVCPTCFDGVKNQGEEDVDCGGPCRRCGLEEELDTDSDGVTDKIELQQGTSATNPDTDGDGLDDKVDRMPLCPNAFCDESYGENEENCPEDCKPTPKFSVLWIILSLLILLLCVGGYLYFQFKKGATKVGKTFGGKVTQREKITFDASRYSGAPKGNARKSSVEKELEQSLQKADKFFKK